MGITLVNIVIERSDGLDQTEPTGSKILALCGGHYEGRVIANRILQGVHLTWSSPDVRHGRYDYVRRHAVQVQHS